VSLSTRSRLLVALRWTSLHGFAGRISSFNAQEKIADTAASVWFATIGASMPPIIAFTSARVIVAACSLPQRGSAWRRISLSPCRQLLLRRLACCSRYRAARSAKVPAPRFARFLGCRVLAARHGEHCFGSERPRIG